MFYGFLADAVGIIHLSYVSFVVFGQILILLGICFHWSWIRNLRFRIVHLIMILIVALESLGEIMCPLTTWENQLRVWAGQDVIGDSFVAHLLNNIMFFNDISSDHWIFKAAYLSFAAIVLLTFIFAPPRRSSQASPANLPTKKPDPKGSGLSE